MTFAAGLACEGLKPVVAIYSTFLQRAYDQLIHDVALQNLPVVFALDRAGLVGADGATHAGNYDIAFLRCIPNMSVMAPSDENECRQMLTTAFAAAPGPVAVRYPRGAGAGVAIAAGTDARLPIGKGEVRPRRQGASPSWPSARWWRPALEAAEGLDATVANMRFVKPLDVELLLKSPAHDHDCLVTVEEGAPWAAPARGGRGAGRRGHRQAAADLGLPDRFIDHGDPGVLLASVGLDAHGIGQSIRERFGVGEPRLVVNN